MIALRAGCVASIGPHVSLRNNISVPVIRIVETCDAASCEGEVIVFVKVTGSDAVLVFIIGVSNFAITISQGNALSGYPDICFRGNIPVRIIFIVYTRDTLICKDRLVIISKVTGGNSLFILIVRILNLMVASCLVIGIVKPGYATCCENWIAINSKVTGINSFFVFVVGIFGRRITICAESWLSIRPDIRIRSEVPRFIISVIDPGNITVS